MRTTPFVTLSLAVSAATVATSSNAVAQTARPAACVAAPGAAQPIIDVHMHAVGSGRGGPLAADTGALHDVIAELDRNHVIAVFASSLMLPRTMQWVRRDPRF